MAIGISDRQLQGSLLFKLDSGNLFFATTLVYLLFIGRSGHISHVLMVHSYNTSITNIAIMYTMMEGVGDKFNVAAAPSK